MVLGAAFVSNGAIEHALVSDPKRSLSWGPTLFRLLLAGHGVALVVYPLLRKKFAKEKSGNSVLNVTEPSLRLERVTTWRAWLVLALLSGIALGLRLWNLNGDLWFDELLTLLNYLRSPLGDIVTSLPDQNNHILFSVLSYTSVQIFGESAWAVRLPSVLFGVMSLWALFLLGRRVIGTKGALFACALMTVSYHHIWFSQNARGYMALLFFSLLATWLWLEAMEHDSNLLWFTYALAVTGGMLSHMTMAFVVAAHFVLYLAMLLIMARRRSNGRSWWASFSENFNWRPIFAWVLCVSLTLQFYALPLPEFLRVGLHEVSIESEWTNPWWVITETWRNLRIGFSGLVAVLCGFLMVGLGWLNLLRREWQTGALLVTPALLAGVLMLASGHNLWPRFFFFSMGFALLIAVHGALILPRMTITRLTSSRSSERFGNLSGVVLAAMMIVASAATVPRNYAYPKQDYSGARDYVESRRGANDVVVAVGLAGVAYGRYFAPGWAVAQTEAELNTARGASSQVWLIYTLPVEVKAYRPDVWETIQTEFEVEKVFPGTLGGGEVFVCRQRPKYEKPLVAGL